MTKWTPEYLILHDYGVPKGVTLSDTARNPYNALVYPNGTVRYRTPSAPYTQQAPHAYKLNPKSIGLSYAGAVGGMPTRAGINALRQQVAMVREMYPGIKILTHGQAYQQTKGTPFQASKFGRGPEEASWSKHIDLTSPKPPSGNNASQEGQPPMSPPIFKRYLSPSELHNQSDLSYDHVFNANKKIPAPAAVSLPPGISLDYNYTPRSPYSVPGTVVDNNYSATTNAQPQSQPQARPRHSAPVPPPPIRNPSRLPASSASAFQDAFGGSENRGTYSPTTGPKPMRNPLDLLKMMKR